MAISAPVSFAKVNTALSTSHTDLGNLCKENKVNMYSKYKPIKYSKVGVLTDNDYNTDVGDNDYIIKWGVKRLAQYTFLSVEENGVIKDQPWSWNKPSGGSSSPYRLSDYNGYAHDAVCPIQITMSNGNELIIPQSLGGLGVGMGFVFTFGVAITGYNSSTCLSLNNLLRTDEMNYYPTVVFIHAEGSGSSLSVSRYCISADKTVAQFVATGNPVATVVIDTSSLYSYIDQHGSMSHLNNGKEWTAVLFLCANKCTGDISSNVRCTRLTYRSKVDQKTYTVRRLTIADLFSSLYAVITFSTRSSGSRQYYISKIVYHATPKNDSQYYINIGFTLSCGYRGTISPDGTQSITYAIGKDYMSVQTSSTVTKTSYVLDTNTYYPTATPDGKYVCALAINIQVAGVSGIASGSATFTTQTSIDVTASFL